MHMLFLSLHEHPDDAVRWHVLVIDWNTKTTFFFLLCFFLSLLERHSISKEGDFILYLSWSFQAFI